MSNFQETLKIVDHLIRTGKFSKARKSLLGLKLSRNMDIEERIEAASLWKRVGEPMRAIKILGSMEKFDSRISPKERKRWLEYADCLLKVNALGGVSRILSNPQFSSETKYHLLRGFYFIHSWDYQNALDSLRLYLGVENPQSYSFYVAQINELACLAFLEKGGESLRLAEQLLPKLSELGYERLLGNSVEILLQVTHQSLGIDDKNKLQELIHRFSKVSWDDVAILDNLQLRKWKSYAELQRGMPAALESLQELRRISLDKKLSEIVRDVDRMIAQETQSFEKEVFLFFGTPYSAFLRHFHLAPQKDEIYISRNLTEQSWVILPFDSEKEVVLKKRIFDVHDFCREQNYSLIARLLLSMFKDFYRAPTTVELFDSIYPEEYFHPISSLRKVNQLVHRLNSVLQETGWKIRIVEQQSEYRMEGVEKIFFRLQEPSSMTLKKDHTSILEEYLRNLIPRPFQFHEALFITKKKRRTLQLILKHLVDADILNREGRTNKVTYFWVNPKEDAHQG